MVAREGQSQESDVGAGFAVGMSVPVGVAWSLHELSQHPMCPVGCVADGLVPDDVFAEHLVEAACRNARARCSPTATARPSETGSIVSVGGDAVRFVGQQRGQRGERVLGLADAPSSPASGRAA